eukprot:TRINITY_DN101061_c0_g1_i1.p1 TRINITY_DN101061_c0_g1~~TRINITY_DN101061_c0_g1_i1.p1  ORF type:complete len:304 (+),score=38.37 TRINITY_DN101061_c0_g1_i1:117-1028(+)
MHAKRHRPSPAMDRRLWNDYDAALLSTRARGERRYSSNLLASAVLALGGCFLCMQPSASAFAASSGSLLRRTMLRVLDVKTSPAPPADDLDEDSEPASDAVEGVTAPKPWNHTREFKSYAYMKSVVPSTYPVINLDRSSIARPIATKVQAYFDEAMVSTVDLVVGRANCDEGRDNRGTILYSLALLPRRLDVAAEVLPRRLRGLTRLRVYKGLKVNLDDKDKSYLHVSGDTDPEKLAQVMLYRLKKLVRTVQLAFVGGKAATKAMIAIEEVYWQARNEIVVVPRLDSFDDSGKATIMVSVTLA